MCRKFGDGLCTPAATDEFLKDTLIRNIDCLVADAGRVEYVVPPEKNQA